MLCFLNAMKMIGSTTTSVGEGKIISAFWFFTKIITTFIDKHNLTKAKC